MLKVLQIERPRDNGIRPSREVISRIDYSTIYPNISQHANEVAERMYDTYGTPCEKHIIELSDFALTSGLMAGMYNLAGKEEYPPVLGYDLINISAGATNGSSWFRDALDKMDRLIERDNVVVIVGLPNKGQETVDGKAVGLFSLCKNVITVGCVNGSHHTWPNRAADVLFDEAYTSWATPRVSAVALVLMEYLKGLNVQYHWTDIKHLLQRLLPSNPSVERIKKEADTYFGIGNANIDVLTLNNEIAKLKQEVQSLRNLWSVKLPIDGNFYQFKNSTEIRSAMVGEKPRTPIAVAFPHDGQWVKGKGIYDKVGKTIYVTVQ